MGGEEEEEEEEEEGVGLDFLALLALFPSVIPSFFTENKGSWAPGPFP